MKTFRTVSALTLHDLTESARAESLHALHLWHAADKLDPAEVGFDSALANAALEATDRASTLWHAVELFGGTVDPEISRVRWC
jgi:hypothetical protein